MLQNAENVMNKLNIFLITGNPRKCKKNQNTLKYIIRAIVMFFLHANVIPVNPQIHANVMRPLFVLNYIFEPLFVHVPNIVHFLKFLLNTLVNKISWYCKCGTDRKYTETNNNVYIAVLMIFVWLSKYKNCCVHLICIACFIWSMFILKIYR
jgi:hypothetical protein